MPRFDAETGILYPESVSVQLTLFDRKLSVLEPAFVAEYPTALDLLDANEDERPELRASIRRALRYDSALFYRMTKDGLSDPAVRAASETRQIETVYFALGGDQPALAIVRKAFARGFGSPRVAWLLADLLLDGTPFVVPDGVRLEVEYGFVGNASLAKDVLAIEALRIDGAFRSLSPHYVDAFVLSAATGEQVDRDLFERFAQIHQFQRRGLVVQQATLLYVVGADDRAQATAVLKTVARGGFAIDPTPISGELLVERVRDLGDDEMVVALLQLPFFVSRLDALGHQRPLGVILRARSDMSARARTLLAQRYEVETALIRRRLDPRSLRSNPYVAQVFYTGKFVTLASWLASGRFGREAAALVRAIQPPAFVDYPVRVNALLEHAPMSDETWIALVDTLSEFPVLVNGEATESPRRAAVRAAFVHFTSTGHRDRARVLQIVRFSSAALDDDLADDVDSTTYRAKTALSRVVVAFIDDVELIREAAAQLPLAGARTVYMRARRTNRSDEILRLLSDDRENAENADGQKRTFAKLEPTLDTRPGTLQQ